MKRFTIFGFLLLFIGTAFAQTPVITKLWDWSIQGTAVYDPVEMEWIPGTAPAWMGGTTERGMAYYNGKLYVASRKTGKQIVVLDAATGEQLTDETITLPDDPVTGGTLPINSICITPAGVMYVGNLTANTASIDAETSLANSPFKVYKVTPNAGGTGYDVTTVINWNNAGVEGAPTYRLGDGLGVYVNDEQNGYIITGDAFATPTAAFVLKWTITAGVVSADPAVIQLSEVYPAPAAGVNPKLGIAPQLFPIDLELFMVDGHSTYPMLVDMTGNMVATFSGDVKPQQSGISGVAYAMFKDRYFVVAPTTNHTGAPKSAFEAFEIVGGDFTQAVSLGILPELGLGGATNASYVSMVAMNVMADELFFYVMSANNGIAGFKLTLESGNSVPGLNENSSVTVYPVPALDVLNFSERMASVELYNLAGQVVRKAINADKINVSGLKGSFIVKAIDQNGKPLNKVIAVK